MIKRIIRIMLLLSVCYCVIMVYNLPAYMGKNIPHMAPARLRQVAGAKHIHKLDFDVEDGPVHVFELDIAKNVQVDDENNLNKPTEIHKQSRVVKSVDEVQAAEINKPSDTNISTTVAELPNRSREVNQKVAGYKYPSTDISAAIVKSVLQAKKSVKPIQVDKPTRKRHQNKEAKHVLDVSSTTGANVSDVVQSEKVFEPVVGNERISPNVKKSMEECSPEFSHDNIVFCNETVPQWEELVDRFPKLQEGGHYMPKNCVPHQHVAIIVPYRDREEHLKLFMQHMHNFLQTKEIEYTIFVVEQDNSTLFKKGLLMNAGFLEVTMRTGISCFMFHDVDMLPLDYRINYSCPENTVWHPSVYIRQYNFRKPYIRYFGGVLTFEKRIFQKVNGFSNLYWGWGGEDDDMFFRLKAKHIGLEEPNDELRYESWSHTRQKEFANSFITTACALIQVFLEFRTPVLPTLYFPSHLVATINGIWLRQDCRLQMLSVWISLILCCLV